MPRDNETHTVVQNCGGGGNGRASEGTQQQLQPKECFIWNSQKERERKRELKRLISESENESGKKILCRTL